MATISCQDCGQPRTHCPRNTRYCKPCRLLRDLAYWHRNRRNCKECRKEFAPIGRTDYHCSSCDTGLLHLSGPCRLANPEPHDGPPTLTGIPVCAKCMRSPKMRSYLIKVLQKGQAQRRAANR